MIVKKVVYPGTFDPMTNGHVDIIQRAAVLFDQVIVAIAESSHKNPLLLFEQRIELAQQALSHLTNVYVEKLSGLTVDFVVQQGAIGIVRGLRFASDFDYENQLASMNTHLNKNIETIFLAANCTHAYISSTIVREIYRLQGDVSLFVPSIIAEYLKSK